MYFLVDCDNFFVSCERVFQPDLKGKPVVVLSNNDGCVVARSNEAKVLGVRMGIPLFKIQPLVARHQVQLRSSNYTLYADMSNRVMAILRELAGDVEVYSIDEAFFFWSARPGFDYQAFGQQVVERVQQWLGLPVSIGIASTRTLAKVAAYYAKHYPAYRKVCVIDTDEKRIKALQLLPVEEIWGVGRLGAVRLRTHGVENAGQLVNKSQQYVKRHLTIAGVKVWQELRGVSVIRQLESVRRQSICTSRSFPKTVAHLSDLESFIGNFAAKCACKLRADHSVAGLITVFVQTDVFRKTDRQHSASFTYALITPANSTFEIVEKALIALRQCVQDGCAYKRAGVIVSGIAEDKSLQMQLFDELTPEQRAKFNRLSEIMDQMNHKVGSEVLRLGVQQMRGEGQNQPVEPSQLGLRRDYLSRCYTTRLEEVIIVQ